MNGPLQLRLARLSFAFPYLQTFLRLRFQRGRSGESSSQTEGETKRGKDFSRHPLYPAAQTFLTLGRYNGAPRGPSPKQHKPSAATVATVSGPLSRTAQPDIGQHPLSVAIIKQISTRELASRGRYPGTSQPSAKPDWLSRRLIRTWNRGYTSVSLTLFFVLARTVLFVTTPGAPPLELPPPPPPPPPFRPPSPPPDPPPASPDGAAVFLFFTAKVLGSL